MALSSLTQPKYSIVMTSKRVYEEGELRHGHFVCRDYRSGRKLYVMVINEVWVPRDRIIELWPSSAPALAAPAPAGGDAASSLASAMAAPSGIGKATKKSLVAPRTREKLDMVAAAIWPGGAPPKHLKRGDRNAKMMAKGKEMGISIPSEKTLGRYFQKKI
jgi:hypothetical protein